MKITREFFKERDIGLGGFKWWCENCEGLETIEQIRKLNEHRFEWANWLITRLMNLEGHISYAVFSAEQVINVFEKKRPNDNRPRKAIELAKKWLNEPSQMSAAVDESSDVTRAAFTASKDLPKGRAFGAACASANACASAADAVRGSVRFFYASIPASEAAAYAAFAAYDDNTTILDGRIIEYGISLINQDKMEKVK